MSSQASRVFDAMTTSCWNCGQQGTRRPMTSAEHSRRDSDNSDRRLHDWMKQFREQIFVCACGATIIMGVNISPFAEWVRLGNPWRRGLT